MATGSSPPSRKKISAHLKDDGKLHRLCREGRLNDIEDLFRIVPYSHIADFLNRRRGFFGYTPLHEAISGNQPSILSYLAYKGADINACASSGYTPLHLAASAGYIDCVKALLGTGADISIRDNFDKTPLQTAELGGKTNIVKLLRSEAIVKECKMNGNNLTDLLKGKVEDLEPNCLEKALIAAVETGNLFNIGKLLIKGATNIEEALERAKVLLQYKVCAILLLVMAAQMDDKKLVHKLYGVPDVYHVIAECEEFPEIQKITRTVSTVVPIEMARRFKNHSVREELLLYTNVNKEAGSVDWHGLRLLLLEVPWFCKIFWVKELLLSGNGLRGIHNEIGNYLKQVVRLDLQNNDLVTLPNFIFELPNLSELNLNENKLKSIPDVNEWSQELSIINLSHNELSNLPLNVTADSIKNLDLSYNQFRSIPLCICSFVGLRHLNISFNRDILSLPVEMGRLVNLDTLLIEGLKDLCEPPRHLQNDAHECIHYLYTKLRKTQRFYRMKVVILGEEKTGKTTLVSRLQGLVPDYSFDNCPALHTCDWQYAENIGKRKYQFSLWDFGGEKEYLSSYKCFLSDGSMYLVLWNLTHGEDGVTRMKFWLDELALRVPCSCVLIIGTHLDVVEEQKRPEINQLLHQVAEIAQTYQNKLIIPELIPVGLMNQLENIKVLRDAIYNQASLYKGRRNLGLLMGQEVPGSYVTLIRELEKCQDEIRKGSRDPVMDITQFKEFILELKLDDICYGKEFHDVTSFLNNAGIILHFDIKSYHIDELYFIDPSWLYRTISNLIRNCRIFVNNGILKSNDIPLVLRDLKFPWNYFDCILSLFDHYEIALPLDRYHIFLPFTLPKVRPNEATISINTGDPPLYVRYILITNFIPSGFWSRLISHLIHFVPQLYHGLGLSKREHAKMDFTGEREEGKGKNKREESEIAREGEDKSKIVKEVKPERLISVKAGESFVSIEIPKPAEEREFSLLNVTHVERNNEYTYNPSDHEVILWNEGVVYKGPDVSFAVESINNTIVGNTLYKGIMIMTTPNNKGAKIMCQLVNIINELIRMWFPALISNDDDHIAPCYECRKLGIEKPYEFEMYKITLEDISNNQIKCENGHFVSLIDIVPDLLLCDINDELFLNQEEIKSQGNADDHRNSLLGQGGFGIVYHRKYRGRNVALKKYFVTSFSCSLRYVLNELHHEAKMLSELHHPCIIKLLGLTITPEANLILEEAPMGSLETLLIKTHTLVPRLVMFRIAAQVAAALKYLHSHGIIFLGLKPSDVLIWSLDENSLFHSKLTDFGNSTFLAPSGACGLFAKYSSPEVLYLEKNKTIYNHKTDIFSYGMLLYQMIARRRPFHNISPVKIDTKIIKGELPYTSDLPLADIGYYNLTRLMEDCLRYRPEERPDASRIITRLSDIYFQTMMGQAQIKLAICQGCANTSYDSTKASTSTRIGSELWLCCEKNDKRTEKHQEGISINIYDTNTLTKIKEKSIKEDCVECMCVCGPHIWICSSLGKKSGIIHLYSIDTHELVHSICMASDIIVTSMTCSDTTVYLGTNNGYCFAFSIDLATIKEKDYRPINRYVSEYPINGILVTNKSIWVSHNRFISFLNQDKLQLEHFDKKSQKLHSLVGQLSHSPDSNIVWSASIKESNILTAWDKEKETHLYDINVNDALNKVSNNIHNTTITCLTSMIDVIWVGLETGHILIFHECELITFFHPHVNCINFLIPINCNGPCQKEKCMILSGANIQGENEYSTSKVILWEGYSSTTLEQMKGLQQKSDSISYLDNYESAACAIKRFHFQDDTFVLDDRNFEKRLNTEEEKKDGNNF